MNFEYRFFFLVVYGGFVLYGYFEGLYGQERRFGFYEEQKFGGYEGYIDYRYGGYEDRRNIFKYLIGFYV